MPDDLDRLVDLLLPVLHDEQQRRRVIGPDLDDTGSPQRPAVSTLTTETGTPARSAL